MLLVNEIKIKKENELLKDQAKINHTTIKFEHYDLVNESASSFFKYKTTSSKYREVYVSVGKKLKESIQIDHLEYLVKMEFNDGLKLEGYLDEVTLKAILSEFDPVLPPLEKLF